MHLDLKVHSCCLKKPYVQKFNVLILPIQKCITILREQGFRKVSFSVPHGHGKACGKYTNTGKE